MVLAEADAKKPARIFIDDPAVIAGCSGNPASATRIRVQLTAADPVRRTVGFAAVG